MKKSLWFKRKVYGWGWYPATWQGWTITLAYIGMVFFFGMSIDENSSSREVALSFILPVILLTVGFIRIAYRTGEKPKWQWGKKRS